MPPTKVCGYSRVKWSEGAAPLDAPVPPRIAQITVGPLLPREESVMVSPMVARLRIRREENLRELLTSRGIRVTEQRLVILRELAALRVPVSHPELTERLASDSLDRATIYRNLVALTEAGLLVRTQLGDNVWRYEMPSSPAASHGAHPHFVCTDCGDVSCLEEGDVQLSGRAAAATISEVQLRGRCGTCNDDG